jgi:peptidoglycan/LPS O-acetylase OafA/YrhL
VSRLSQTRETRPAREPKIKQPSAAATSRLGDRFGGTYLADMLAPDRNSFAIVRMAMALAVLVSHSYWFAIGTVGSQPLVKWTGHSLGEHAVQVFFLLSGILVAQSLQRSGSIVDYLSARALRIFPALFVCVFLTAFILGPIVTNLGIAEYLKDSRVAGYIVKTLTLSTGSAPLPGVFTNVPLANLVNVSLWTLKFEVLCYITLAGLAIAGLMTERYRAWSAIALALFVSVVFLRQPNAAVPYTAVDNIRYLMVFFFTGVLAFQSRTWLLVHGLMVLPLAAIFVASIGTRFVEISSAVFLGYAMLWISTFSFGPLRAFTNKNDYSYGTYIYAGPIQQMIVHFLPGFAPWVITAFAVGIAVPLAVYSWELIERPALAMRRPIRDWLFAVRHRIEANWAWLAPARPLQPLPLAADASAYAPVFSSMAIVPNTAGAEFAMAPPVSTSETLTPPARRVRRPTLVAPVSSPVPIRRQRHALDLKIIKVSPEVAAMHQSKTYAESAAKVRNVSSTDTTATYAARPDPYQRTPYARNWLMSLGWLNSQQKAGTNLDDLARFRQRSTSTSGNTAPRKITVTAIPTRAVVQPEATVPTALPRLTLRTWLAALTNNRTGAVEAAQPVAEITADRMAQALRPRTQSRPKWSVPANDTAANETTDDHTPQPLPI